MSNPTDAPPRIWLHQQPTLGGLIVTAEGYFPRGSKDLEGATEYIRADLAAPTEDDLNRDFAIHLGKRLQELALAARRLIRRLHEVHDSDEYKAVWESAQLHRGPYVGPTYESELKELEATLENARATTPPSPDVLPVGTTSTCDHCNQPYITARNDGSLCARCFITGHRGFVCGSYCVVTKQSEALAHQFTQDYAVNPELSPHGFNRASSPAPDKGEVARRLAELTDDERLELFNQYCKSCGGDDPRCQCWNDE